MIRQTTPIIKNITNIQIGKRAEVRPGLWVKAGIFGVDVGQQGDEHADLRRSLWVQMNADVFSPPAWRDAAPSGWTSQWSRRCPSARKSPGRSERQRERRWHLAKQRAASVPEEIKWNNKKKFLFGRQGNTRTVLVLACQWYTAHVQLILKYSKSQNALLHQHPVG